MRFRFNHFYFLLMSAAGISAFVIPQKYSDKAQPQIQGLFAPVAIPARWAGAALERRMEGPTEQTDTRPLAAIREQNDYLQMENARLTQTVEQLQELNDQRNLVGLDIRKLCTPVRVVGTDAGPRESLAVSGSSLEGLREGMCVLYSGGIVGTLQRSGLAGGQVQLVTNKGFHAMAYFGSFREGGKKFIRLNKEHVTIRGNGDGTMVCDMLPMADVNRCGLRPGDWVMLDDPEDWPVKLQNRRIGKVASVEKRMGYPLFAEIHIRPESDLKKLKEVMVLTKN